MKASRYVAVRGASGLDSSRRETARDVRRPRLRRRAVRRPDGRYLILYSRAPGPGPG